MSWQKTKRVEIGMKKHSPTDCGTEKMYNLDSTSQRKFEQADLSFSWPSDSPNFAAISILSDVPVSSGPRTSESRVFIGAYMSH